MTYANIQVITQLIFAVSWSLVYVLVFPNIFFNAQFFIYYQSSYRNSYFFKASDGWAEKPWAKLNGQNPGYLQRAFPLLVSSNVYTATQLSSRDYQAGWVTVNAQSNLELLVFFRNLCFLLELSSNASKSEGKQFILTSDKVLNSQYLMVNKTLSLRKQCKCCKRR